MLKEYGLKEYEAKAYSSLIFANELTAAELSRIADIPQPRIYDVLSSLESKGLVEIRQGRPQKFRAVDPKIGLQMLAKDLTERLNKLTKSVLLEIEKQKSQAQSSLTLEEPRVWIVRNIEKAKEKVKSLIESANIDVVVSSPASLLNELSESLSYVVENKKNVAVAIVCYYDGSKLQFNFDSLAFVKERPTPSLPVMMIDGSYSIIFGEDYSLELGEIELTRILSDFFYYSLWKPSKLLSHCKLSDYKTTSHIWLAIELIKSLKGRQAFAKVSGFETKTRNLIELKGSIVDYKIDPNGIFKNFTILTEGKKLLVGGFGASTEDVEARLITISSKPF